MSDNVPKGIPAMMDGPNAEVVLAALDLIYDVLADRKIDHRTRLSVAKSRVRMLRYQVAQYTRR